MTRRRTLLSVLFCLLFLFHYPTNAQYRALETDDLRLIYYDLASDFLVKYTARSFHNSLDVYKELYGYEPTEAVTLFVHDLGDHGNAGADVIPRNFINMRMAPLSYSFETAPANERINSTLHHELVHVLANDNATGSDNVFRTLFAGKIPVSDDDPVTILFSYLTNPRRYAPRWYQEGIAVFMETWMSGGIGRSLGGYDEMVFRTRVAEDKHFFDMVGLEAEGAAADFQVGVNSYLYGTRFMSYLAYIYSPEQVVDWMNRPSGSKANFASRFKQVFGLPIGRSWDEWISFEKDFQRVNLESVSENPVTPYREIAARPLGSMSRAFIDSTSNSLVAAVNYPGTLSHIMSVDLDTGKEQKITGVRGPTLFTVASVAFDPANRRVFYTTDNNRWRSLVSVDLDTGAKRTLLKKERIGDLAFNRADGSLWGVRHFLGFSTIVRIPPPYEAWETVDTMPYGRDIYDLDVSPDGKWMTAAVAEINGDQRLVRASTDSLLAGSIDYAYEFDFGRSNPEGFVFSPDGSSLYGSSYYSGVSNIFRYDFADSTVYALTNGETGYFRPIPMGGDSLIAFRYTTDGFQPVMIEDKPVQVSAVEFLGQRVYNEHKEVIESWKAPPPSRIDLDSLGYTDMPYRSTASIELEGIHPILHGYKDDIAVGLKMNLSDPLGLNHLSIYAAITPSASSDSLARIGEDERFHVGLTYRYFHVTGGEWTLSAAYNGSDFYDLFGPTKRSRKGYRAGLTYENSISYDGPRKNLSYEIGVAGFFDLEKLPSFQNIVAPFTELGQAHASLTYKNLQSSLGSVDRESGYTASLNASSNYVNEEFFPRISADLALGTLLPIPHLSLWLRSSVGISAGEPDNPFANFYFGGFRNNYVDKRSEKQYREAIAFPGLEIDEIGGSNYAKVMAELILPPIRFRHIGGTMLFLKWMRLSVFASALYVNLDQEFDLAPLPSRQRAFNVGAQVDIQIQLFSYLRSMLS
ncbi:MAG: hypothetical protein IH951_15220, partial [Bacteroidetes bacterium]|nr:hypothetical protein [Bacteroidota bacterium]